MTKATPIKATFVDAKPVKTRGQVQFIFEVPVNEATAALNALGGYPLPASEVWCGIVLLDLSKSRHPSTSEPTPESSKDRRKFHDLPLPQQAGMLCADPAFQQFLVERYDGFKNEEDAAATLREICGVKSRSEIAGNTNAASSFREIIREFEAWKLVPA